MSTTRKTVRTRFAPSPTGFMHIGNLRTALYEYLVARSLGGQFILRIEDTDQERYVEGAVEKIYETLAAVGLKHDEGPDVGGGYGPYVQSERRGFYRPIAEKLVEEGKAYYCFCSQERLAHVHADQKNAASGDTEQTFIGYDRHCRDLPQTETDSRVAAGEPYVIRQRMPLTGETSFHDEVFGTITVQNSTLEDQVLIKSDGFPTYNFANVADDHAMAITHVVRGSEYLSSTPKYQLLYDALGYEPPVYIHLPLILGSDGQKLSKRHGATSFEELIEQGFLPEAVTNYLGLLGWSPSNDTREMYTLEELEEAFTIEGIAKSPATFSIDKLTWFNGEYIRKLSAEEFLNYIRPVLDEVLPGLTEEQEALAAEILQPRINRLPELREQIIFMSEQPDYDTDIFVHKRSKSTVESSARILSDLIPVYEQLEHWSREALHRIMIDYAQANELKNGTVMWPVRIGVSGQTVTPGGAAEIMTLTGRDESLARLKKAYERLTNE